MREWRAMVDALHSRVYLGAGRLIRAAVDDAVTTIFPGDCRACRGPLVRAGLVPVCEACVAQVRRQRAAMCFRCGEALDMESARFAGQFPADGLICHACRMAPPAFERAVAYAEYRDELREMIHLLKYERMRGVARLLGGMLAEAVLMLEGAAGPSVSREMTVVAVPLFPSKQRQRGYNQSELLADAANAELRCLRPGWTLRRDGALLRRVRDTERQFGLSAKGRRRNLQGAFEADASRIVPGCEVLLVDDIYTTGATARQCAGVLRRAGAGKVWVVTLARAQAVRVEMWDGGVRQRVGFG